MANEIGHQYYIRYIFFKNEVYRILLDNYYVFLCAYVKI